MKFPKHDDQIYSWNFESNWIIVIISPSTFFKVHHPRNLIVPVCDFALRFSPQRCYLPRHLYKKVFSTVWNRSNGSIFFIFRQVTHTPSEASVPSSHGRHSAHSDGTRAVSAMLTHCIVSQLCSCHSPKKQNVCFSPWIPPDFAQGVAVVQFWLLKVKLWKLFSPLMIFLFSFMSGVPMFSRHHFIDRLY